MKLFIYINKINVNKQETRGSTVHFGSNMFIHVINAALTICISIQCLSPVPTPYACNISRFLISTRKHRLKLSVYFSVLTFFDYLGMPAGVRQ